MNFLDITLLTVSGLLILGLPFFWKENKYIDYISDRLF